MPKKIGLVGFLLVIVLSACNLPGANQSVDLPLEDIVNTKAAETAAANFEARTATYVAQLIPTDTPTPTETLTLTPTQTATLTLTPTRTLVPNDPRGRYGEPDWVEPFDNSDNWSTYEGDATRVEIKDGAFFYTAFEPTNKYYWRTSWPVIKNFYMEVTVKTPSDCSGRDLYGLIFRAPDPNTGYYLAFSCDGEYQLLGWSTAGIFYLTPWNSTPVIDPGPNQTNRLGILANGDQLTVYANGVALSTALDQTFLSAGKFGFFIASENTTNLTFTFDDLMYWVLQ